MELRDLRRLLLDVDHMPNGFSMSEEGSVEVVFDTATHANLKLLSVYYDTGDGKIHIDVG